MKSVMRFIVTLTVLMSAIAVSYHSNTKLRRDGVLNLYPFPRVGRASRNTWQLPHSELYLEYEPSIKRQLYAFPRVGRNDFSLPRDEIVNKYQPNQPESPGMWFGPRLGRSFKSDEDEITIQNEAPDHSEPEQTEPVPDNRIDTL